MTTQKDATYYLSLPYRLEISHTPAAEGGGYTARIPLLGRRSAVGDGETAEAITDLQTHLPSLIQEWLDKGITIPEPPDIGSHVNDSMALHNPNSASGPDAK